MCDDTFSVVSGSTEGSSPLLLSTIRGSWVYNQQPYLNDGNLSPVIPSQSIDNMLGLKSGIFESRLPTDFPFKENSEDIPMDSQTDLFESQPSSKRIDSLVGQSSEVPSTQSGAKISGACGPDGQRQMLINLMHISLDGEDNCIQAEGRARRKFGSEKDSKSTSSQSTLPPVAASHLVPDGEEISILTEGKSGMRFIIAEKNSESISSQSTLPPEAATPSVPCKRDVLEFQGHSQMPKDAILCSELKQSTPVISNNCTNETRQQYVNNGIKKVSFNGNLSDSIPTALIFHSSIAPASLHNQSISRDNSCLVKLDEDRQKCKRSNSICCDTLVAANSVSHKIDAGQRNEPENKESQKMQNDLEFNDDSGALKSHTKSLQVPIGALKSHAKSLQIHQTEVDTLCRLIKIYDTALKKIDSKKPTAAHLEKLQHITHQLTKGQEEERARLNVLSTKINQTGGADAARRSKYETKLKQLEERQALLNTARCQHSELLQRISSIEARDKIQPCVVRELVTDENPESSITNSRPMSTVGQVTKQDCHAALQKNLEEDNSSCLEVSSSLNYKCLSNQACLAQSKRQSIEEMQSAAADQQRNERGQYVLKRAEVLDGPGGERCIERLTQIQAFESSQSNETNIIDGSGGRDGRHGEHNEMLHLSTDHRYSGSGQKVENPPRVCSVSNYRTPNQQVVVPSNDHCSTVQSLPSDHCSSSIECIASKNEMVNQPNTVSLWTKTAQCTQRPIAEQIETKVTYGGCLNSHVTSGNDYLGDVALVLELPRNDGGAVQSVVDNITSINQDNMKTVQAAQSCPEDKQESLTLQDEKKQQTSNNLTFINPQVTLAVHLNAVTDSENVPVSHISGSSSHPPNSPSSTVSSSFFPVSSKELIRRIEVRSAGKSFWNTVQPAIMAEGSRQPPVNLNVAQPSTQHPALKHTLSSAADTDSTMNHQTKKACTKEPAPGVIMSYQPLWSTQLPAGSTVAFDQSFATSPFSNNVNTQTTTTSKCVTFHDVDKLRKPSIKPLRKRGRPKKEYTDCVGNCGSSKNKKNNTQNIRKYFPIVVECSRVRCSDTVEQLADSIGVPVSGRVSSLILADEVGTTPTVTTGQPEESNSSTRNLERVVLIADAEVTNSSRDFPDFFWQENLENITMSKAFWDSLDLW